MKIEARGWGRSKDETKAVEDGGGGKGVGKGIVGGNGGVQ